MPTSDLQILENGKPSKSLEEILADGEREYREDLTSGKYSFDYLNPLYEEWKIYAVEQYNLEQTPEWQAQRAVEDQRIKNYYHRKKEAEEKERLLKSNSKLTIKVESD